ncbi:hypothetical protein NDU88_003653 [Pleurodeles waltl]|uniref:Uncharacterized protein n=1 Tax=Pleurodeles waltl TaxID=8319 RepID=A0AAV7QG88_PLEWA|nr:hypothetical protein NDU88_003653 [Pleurodeles waltl]
MEGRGLGLPPQAAYEQQFNKLAVHGAAPGVLALQRGVAERDGEHLQHLAAERVLTALCERARHGPSCAAADGMAECSDPSSSGWPTWTKGRITCTPPAGVLFGPGPFRDLPSLQVRIGWWRMRGVACSTTLSPM